MDRVEKDPEIGLRTIQEKGLEGSRDIVGMDL